MLAADNLDFIIPILLGVAIALGIVKAEAIMAAAASAGGAIASGAAWAAAHWPIILIAIAFAGALVAAIWTGNAGSRGMGWRDLWVFIRNRV